MGSNLRLLHSCIAEGVGTFLMVLFGVGSVAFNHALSDIVGVLRYIWIRAGGADRRSLFPLDKDHLVLLAPGAQDR